LDSYCYTPLDNGNDDDNDGDDGNSQENDNNGTDTTAIEQAKIHIDTIVFNPEGSDTNREQIQLSLLSHSKISVKDFKLKIGERTTKLFYEELNGDAWLYPQQEKTFLGNFRFPNSKKICVDLMRNEKVFDHYCYDGAQEEKKGPQNIINYSGDQIKIKNILFDPPGSDKDKENIKLYF